MIKQLGFNAFRVHMKVESRRFYHHADRLGIMILQDMPRSAMVTGRSEHWFGLELQAMVTNLRNHPSVVQYQIFNEGGGGDGSCSFVCEQVQRVRAQPKDLLSRRIIGKCSRSLCVFFRRSLKQRLHRHLRRRHTVHVPAEPRSLRLPGALGQLSGTQLDRSRLRLRLRGCRGLGRPSVPAAQRAAGECIDDRLRRRVRGHERLCGA